MANFFLRFEGVNITNLIGDTKDLSTIRGSSLLLLNATKEIQNQFPSLKPLSLGASSGLFELVVQDRATAEEVAQQLRNQLHNEIFKNATFVLDVVEATDADNFVRDRERALALNRWRQLRSPTVAIPQQNTDLQAVPCEENRVRPAAPIMGAQLHALSPSVRARRNYGLSQKQNFYEEQTGRQIGRFFTRDFDELTGGWPDQRLNHKMAVIYLDGNRFGAIQNEKCRTVAKQMEFDEKVRALRRTLLSNLIDFMDFHGGWFHSDRYRFETLQWGGDEITWVVPAWQGWPLLNFFYQQTNDPAQDWNFDGEPLTHSGGLVFCHHNAPIHRITKLARELADSVKEATGRAGNYFAYEVLESFDHIGRRLDEYRTERTPLVMRQDPAALILNGEGLDDVIQHVVVLKKALPRRQLYNIVEKLLINHEEARQAIRNLLSELDQETKDRLRALFPTLGGAGPLTTETLLADRPIIWMHLVALWDYLVDLEV